jgi:NitT/TauT family transport system ATP-binding protein
MATKIKISHLRKEFRNNDGGIKVAIDDVSLSMEDGSFTTVVGPSGCGKSTMLNIMAGIETVTSGEIAIATEANRPPRVGYVFQAARLLPWMSVMDNMEFVRPRDADKAKHRQSAEHYLKMVGLGGEFDRFPLQLSGGMQQRVGIARALAIDPDVLLMDEPFSHLDELNAEKLRVELSRIWKETGKTIIFVTHDLQEAITLGDRMVIFSFNGQLKDDLAIDLPRPRDFAKPEVAAFLGDCTAKFSAAQRMAERVGIKS